MTAHFGHSAGMTIPKWLRLDLSLMEAAIIGTVLIVVVAALLEFAQFMRG